MRVLLAAALAALALPLAAAASSRSASVVRAAPNGEASKSADQILADSEKAALAACSVHMVAGGTSSGTSLSFNLYLLAGRGGRGAVSENGLSFDIVRLGGEAYFEASPAFWRHYGGAAAATLLSGRWISASATKGDFASFTPLTDLVAFVKALLGSHGVLKVGATQTVDGRSVIPLIDTTQGGTLYVAATGPPYPLELAQGTGGKGSISFDGWNAALSVKAPKGAIPYSEFTTHG